MKRSYGFLFVSLALAAPLPAAAQAGEEGFDGAAGADVIWLSDADETEVVRTGVNLDVDYDGPEEYLGIRLEHARFNPLGQGWTSDQRFYLRAANRTGGWAWAANVGTDGHTALGSITLHDEAAFRKELFVERDIVETRRGVRERIYYTFAGAALDLPIDDRNVVTVVGGVQEFTGDNRRVHLRGNYVHVLDPERGLSVQLRTRWFHNSDPREFDYYSPRWYAQILPVLQMRRTSDSGWRYLLAAGLGAQRDSESDWRRSSYLNAQVTSPRVGDGWAMTGALTFSETPTAAGTGYRFLQVSAGATYAF